MQKMETNIWSSYDFQLLNHHSDPKSRSISKRAHCHSRNKYIKESKHSPSSTTSRHRWASRSSRLFLACCILANLWTLSPTTAEASSSHVQTYSKPYKPLAGQFLHITDIHPDEYYVNGGSISASCHRIVKEGDEAKALRQLRPGRTEGGNGGRYGAAYSICDAPFSLANATFDWIDKKIADKLDFVVWTGDNARHDSDNERPRTQQEIEDLNRRIAERFLTTFAPDEDDPYRQRIPIVPSIGNNDVYPHNIMQAGPNRILQHFSEIWSEFIPESQYHTFQHGGYFAVEVVPDKLAVISLNTLYFFNSNAAVDGCFDEDEPGTDQMDWLEVELESMRKRGMTVYLSGHVPPARKSYSPTCFVRYTNIALKYQDVIVGHLYGHANIDHFFILSQATIENQDSIIANAKDEDLSQYQHEFDAFHMLGLDSYLLELWEQYQVIPKKAKINEYAIVNVAPSVIPTYNPALRVYSYRSAQEKSISSAPDTLLTVQDESTEEVEVEEEEEEEEEDKVDIDMNYSSGYVMRDINNSTIAKKKKPNKPRKPRKPRKPKNPRPVSSTAFGFPLGFTQYWMNLTHINLELEDPEYLVEYDSKDWGLQDLSIAQWLGLARKVIGKESVKDLYLARMVVLTGAQNDI